MNACFAASFQPDRPPPETPASYIAPSCPLRVAVTEVERLLRSTKKKSPGPDGVPYWVLRTYAGLLSPSVASLFNRSFETGCVPASFKEAIITPVPKKPRPSSPSDYRPISLLPLLSKIAEKLFRNALD